MTVAHTAAPLDVTDSEQAMMLLREQGMRVSAARRLVIEALFTAPGPVSAEQIAGGVAGLPASDLTSVYRNLEALERVGLVRHFHAGHGPGLYTLAARDGREHLACEVCGSVLTVDADQLEPARELLRDRFDFEASFAHFPIVGTCGRCARKRRPRNKPSKGAHR
jgi:Fur family transcriptional regulator, ferric uptake regulator